MQKLVDCCSLGHWWHHKPAKRTKPVQLQIFARPVQQKQKAVDNFVLSNALVTN